ncbi:non-specific lipid transfer protein GPI-anchored 5-like isoform X2 [Rhodamnia argentea]|uniref:Non-specific lipid transfer protein GPI-anchored 5-like isoform X2 n=1 Tax=Rhodamnia argentea TaxID=178133 RepID=A0A8B8PMW7_9MYRT|nr:non-specific lipid transfer protein GPI-anchored 5-like isoform X2 [Rhodamnia argentea]
MAQTRMRIVALVLAMVAAGAAAQSSSCTNALISMSPCLNYITGNSSSPSSSCCSQLANVVRSEPQCLCQALNVGGSSLGISINQTRALAVPSACNIQTQPISRCNAASPSASPTGAPDTPNAVPSDSGTKEVPTTEQDGSSAGSIAELSIPLLFALLFAASYASANT